MMHVFCDLQKATTRADGTIEVEGVAQAQCTDSDGETITAAAMREAMGDFMKFGAVREMHGLKAAGTTIDAWVDDQDRTWLKALIVDPVAVKKVQTKVYRGFSIGGKALERDPEDRTIITKLKWVETSLVDRPNNPEAVLTMWKADGIEPDATSSPDNDDANQENHAMTKAAEGGEAAKVEAGAADTGAASSEVTKTDGNTGDKPAAGTELAKREVSATERAADAKSGNALPDGSFLIETTKDVENAVAAYGRAKNKPAAKAHIKRRAKALGCEDKLPEKWRSSAKKAANAGDIEKAEADVLRKAEESAAAEAALAVLDPDEDAAADVTKTDDAAKSEKPAATEAAPVAPLAKAEAAMAKLEAKVAAASDVTKGMYTVSRLSDVLQSLSYILADVKSEAEMEQDGSPLPKMLRQNLKDLAATLKTMAVEEVDELVAAAEKTKTGGMVAPAYKAAKTGDLSKAEGTGVVDGTMKVDVVGVVRGSQPADDVIKAAAAEIAKAEVARISEERDTLAKAVKDRDDALEKMAARTDKVLEMVDTLAKRLDDVESAPLPPKTAGSELAKVTAVDKGADSAGHASQQGPSEEADMLRKAVELMTPEQRAMLAMKATLQKGVAVAGIGA